MTDGTRTRTGRHAFTEGEVASRSVPEPGLSRAARRSGGLGRGDVGVAFAEGSGAMRAGRRPEAPSLVPTPAERRAFVVNARDGEADPT